MPSFFETVKVVQADTHRDIQASRMPVLQGVKDMLAMVDYHIKHGEQATVIKNGAIVPANVWYWRQEDGYVTYIKFGATPFNLGDGEIAVAGDNLEDVAQLYQKAIEAINDGQFDDQIADINEKRKRRRQGAAQDNEDDKPVGQQPMAPAKAARGRK